MGLQPHVKTSRVAQASTEVGSTSWELMALTAEDTTYLTVQEAVKYWHKETLERTENSQLFGIWTLRIGGCVLSWHHPEHKHNLADVLMILLQPDKIFALQFHEILGVLQQALKTRELQPRHW